MTPDTSAQESPAGEPLPAWIVLPGHPDTPAHVHVSRYSFGARVIRTIGLAAGWGMVAAATFVITFFDPFLSSMPVVIGAVSVWRSWRGRYAVRSFRGSCPRCRTEMALKPGTKVSVPHPLVCYECHHEPELLLFDEGARERLAA